MKALQYISIYVYMNRMSGKERVGEGEKGKGDKLKGTSRPSNKFPIGEYISNRGPHTSIFHSNFLLDFLQGFSTWISYDNFLLQKPQLDFVLRNFPTTSVKQVLQKIKTKR